MLARFLTMLITAFLCFLPQPWLQQSANVTVRHSYPKSKEISGGGRWNTLHPRLQIVYEDLFAQKTEKVLRTTHVMTYQLKHLHYPAYWDP